MILEAFRIDYLAEELLSSDFCSSTDDLLSSGMWNLYPGGFGGKKAYLEIAFSRQLHFTLQLKQHKMQHWHFITYDKNTIALAIYVNK